MAEGRYAKASTDGKEVQAKDVGEGGEAGSA
jgi:hypothetical protein